MTRPKKKRKAKNYANPIKKKGEYYHIDVMIKGQYLRKSLRTKDRREAEKLANEMMRAAYLRDPDDGPRLDLSVSEAIEAWFASKDLSPMTDYRTRLASFRQLLTEKDVHKLNRLQPKHVEAWDKWTIERCKSGKIALDTANSQRKSINDFLSWAKKGKFIDWENRLSLRRRDYPENPSSTRKGKPTQIVRDDDFDRLLAALTGDPLIIAIFAFYGGLRLSEVGRLAWHNVNTQERTIDVFDGKGAKDRVARLRIKGVEVVERNRSEGFVCSCPFPTRAGKTKADYKKAAKSWNGRMYYMITSAIKRHFSESDPIRLIYPHWLRHSFATICLESAVPAPVVGASLGHSSLQITANYAHVRPELHQFDA